MGEQSEVKFGNIKENSMDDEETRQSLLDVIKINTGKVLIQFRIISKNSSCR